MNASIERRPYGQGMVDKLPVSERERTQLLQYLAGYFDGSGSVTIDQSTTNNKGIRGVRFVLRLDMARVQPEVVNLMDQTFPVYHGTQHAEGKPQRNRWYAKAERAMHVLEALSPYLRLKVPQVALAREFTQAKPNRTKDDSLDYKERMRQLNENEPDEIRTPFEIPYLAGFFDAHGSINIYDIAEGFPRLRIELSAKEAKFLEAVASHLGERKVDNNFIGYTANKARKILLILLPFLRIQRRVAELAIALQENRQNFSKRDLLIMKKKEKEIVQQFREESTKIPKKKRKEKVH